MGNKCEQAARGPSGDESRIVREARPGIAVTTDVIVGFRIPYIVGPDTEPLDAKIRNLEWFAENVIAKV